MNEIYLEIARLEENRRQVSSAKALGSRIIRDLNIQYAFASGCRQKEIANAIGLSESRVKKIIGEMKKNEQ